jgi:hypothetical protein
VSAGTARASRISPSAKTACLRTSASLSESALLSAGTAASERISPSANAACTRTSASASDASAWASASSAPLERSSPSPRAACSRTSASLSLSAPASAGAALSTRMSASVRTACCLTSASSSWNRLAERGHDGFGGLLPARRPLFGRRRDDALRGGVPLRRRDRSRRLRSGLLRRRRQRVGAQRLERERGVRRDRCRPRLQARQHDGHQHHRGRGRRGHAARQALSLAGGVEDRQQPPLELRGPRHRERPGRSARAARAARELEQLVGVVRPVRAGAEHEVVARALALDAQPPGRNPCERVEPVDGARGVRERLGQAIVALDVAELVREHGAPLLARPGLGVLGQQHRGMEQAGGHRHAARASAQQAHGARQLDRLGHFLDELGPGRRGERRRPPRVPRHAERPDEQRQSDDHGACEPDETHDGAGLDRPRGR